MQKLLIIALGLGLVVMGWVVHLLWSAGHFKTIEPHFAGSCQAVTGVTGAEDITIHPRTGMAYISACDRRALKAGQNGRGGIFAYDLTDPQPVPVKLTSGPGLIFNPTVSAFILTQTVMTPCLSSITPAEPTRSRSMT